MEQMEGGTLTLPLLGVHVSYHSKLLGKYSWLGQATAHGIVHYCYVAHFWSFLASIFHRSLTVKLEARKVF